MNDRASQTGLILVLSAPSGAGKTSLARRLIADTPRSLFSVSYTTRKPRGSEQNGVDYNFVDTLAFKQKIERGELLEWAEVHDHFYGSPQAMVDIALRERRMAIFDIDVQGGLAIKRKYPEAVLAFVLPPSIAELERRLRDRGTDSDETILKRMLGAQSEVEKGAASYDYLIHNADFESALADLKAIVTAECCRRGRVDTSALVGERSTGGA